LSGGGVDLSDVAGRRGREKRGARECSDPGGEQGQQPGVEPDGHRDADGGRAADGQKNLGAQADGHAEGSSSL
jgi:hypothetical protein